MDFQEYIKPELLILIPVLYLLGMAIKDSKLKDKQIPFVLGVVSVILCGLWIMATEPLTSTQEVATALFTAITQGILIAGASVYTHELIEQSKKEE